MAFRRRGFRRRRGFLRWFTPEEWTDGNPTVNELGLVSIDARNAATAVRYDRVVKGSAPFPGVVNTAGLLSGTQLAERQYFRIRRIVGRMSFTFRALASSDLTSSDAFLVIHWAFVRWHVDENGVPDSPLHDPSVRENQDEKPIIIAQDTWRWTFSPGSAITSGQHFVLTPPGPMYSMIDIKTNRSFRNEQDLFFAWQGHLFHNQGDLSNPVNCVLGRISNLRILGSFGR